MVASPQRIVAVLLDRYGETYAHALSIDFTNPTAAALFQWLCASLLFGARIRAEAALRAAKALFEHGLTTADAMVAASWEERTRILNRSGYARYDESTSRMLGETAQRLIDRYRGDLWVLRDVAGRDPTEERRLLKEFKGIGEVSTDIFMREVQLAWEELYPFADRRSLRAGARLGLGDGAKALAPLVDRSAFPRLIAALVRVDLGKHAEEVLTEAAT